MIVWVRAVDFRALAAEMVDPPRGGREKGKLAILAKRPATAADGGLQHL
jgi:hypothetical protein